MDSHDTTRKPKGRRLLQAAIATVVWLVYMGIGLPVIDSLAPTVGGEGPEGTVAFFGLVFGVVTVGLIMWAVSD